MSNGKEFETNGNINLFGVSFGANDFEGLFSSAKENFPGNVYKTNYDFISSLPFTFGETENGIVVFSARGKLAIARPVIEVVESTNDEFEVVYLTEKEFDEIL
jgi:hypothetical protein